VAVAQYTFTHKQYTEYRERNIEDVPKIFRTDAVTIINLTTKRVWKLSTSTQLRATWHTDSLTMVVLPSTGASRYHNYCIDGGTSPEYFGYTLVHYNKKKERKKGNCGPCIEKKNFFSRYHTFIHFLLFVPLFRIYFLFHYCHHKNSQSSFGWTITNKDLPPPWNYYAMKRNTHKFINSVLLYMILCYVRSLYTYETQRCFRNCVLFLLWNKMKL
jgi:hypothetical protein